MLDSVSVSSLKEDSRYVLAFARYCLPLIPLAIVLRLLTPFLAPYQEYIVLYEIGLALAGATDPYALPPKVEGFITMPRSLDFAIAVVLGLIFAYVALDVAMAAKSIIGDREIPDSRYNYYRAINRQRTPLTALGIAHKVLFVVSQITLFSSLVIGVCFDSQNILYNSFSSYWAADPTNSLGFSVCMIVLVVLYLALGVLVTLWYGVKKRVTASYFWFRIPQQIALTLKESTADNGLARWTLAFIAILLNGALVTMFALAIYLAFAFVFALVIFIMMLPYIFAAAASGGRR